MKSLGEQQRRQARKNPEGEEANAGASFPYRLSALQVKKDYF